MSRSQHVVAICVALVVPAAPCTADEPTFGPLFNGKNLPGWDAEPGLRKDVPAPVVGGKVALPGDVAAEYCNLVLIPILPAK